MTRAHDKRLAAAITPTADERRVGGNWRLHLWPAATDGGGSKKKNDRPRNENRRRVAEWRSTKKNRRLHRRAATHLAFAPIVYNRDFRILSVNVDCRRSRRCQGRSDASSRSTFFKRSMAAIISASTTASVSWSQEFRLEWSQTRKTVRRQFMSGGFFALCHRVCAFFSLHD